MSKKLLITTLVTLAVIIGGIVYLVTSSSDKPTTSTEPAATVASENPEAPSTVSAEGAYVDYKEGIITTTPGTKLLFFHAPWCPQCRDLEADIKLRGVPAGVTIFKVDYDTNQALRKNYGVTLQTTLVKVDDNGELVEKFVAYDDPSLDSVVKNLL